MAGLLDFLLGQSGQPGLLGGYGGPAYPGGGADGGNPYGSAPPAASAAIPAGAMPAQFNGGAQSSMPQGMPSYPDNPLTAMFPAAANTVYQRQATQFALKSLMAPVAQGGRGMSFPEAMIVLQNPKVQEHLFGAPTQTGTAEFPNGTKLPTYSIHGGAPQYAMPQDPTLRGLINAPVKVGDSKVGEIGAPVVYQNGAYNTIYPGQQGTPAAPGAAPSSPQGNQPQQRGFNGQPILGGLQRAIGINNQLLQNKEDIKNDSDAFTKDFTGIQSAGRNAIAGSQQAQLLKHITLDPNFYSGPLSDYVKTYRQAQAIFGSDPGKAAPAELFTKIASNMLQEQIKSMGQSGVGRVLMAEVNIMRQAIASMDNTPQGNRALAEILSRTYQHQQAIAEIARSIKAPPGQRSAMLNQAVDQYLKQSPLFSPQELQHPSILGAPDAPQGATRWTPQQARAWGQSVGLKPGDPIRINGHMGAIP